MAEKVHEFKIKVEIPVLSFTLPIQRKHKGWEITLWTPDSLKTKKKGRDTLPVFESNQSHKRKENNNNQNSQQKESLSLNQNETLQLQQIKSQRSSPVLPSNILQLQKAYGNRATEQWVKSRFQSDLPIQRAVDKENKTGLPDQLKSGVENLSGLSLDDVKVHYNSAKPAELEALAYAQGTDIHVGPGQEQNLPHEAWHIAQQKQGRVKPTLQMNKHVQINDDAGLENEADQMGAKAMQLKSVETATAINGSERAQTDVVQLRGENPHAQAGALGGWDLTAHHIVAHSKLEDSLKKLKEKEEAGEGTPYTDVLLHAIPDKLTKNMLDNLKVVVEDSDDKREEYRQILLDKSRGHNEEVYNIRLGDVRKSFFEWQGGNQYMGPNTSIRAEPTSNKDDIDFDGEYFGNLTNDKFKKLTELGGKLDQDSEKDNIEKNLKAILDITKNEVPNVFDASKWTEIGSLATLTELSKNLELKRDHILKYSFFKLGMDEIGLGKKYSDITNSSGEYKYKGLPMELQAKGTSGYIPVAKAQTIVPKEESSKTLLSLLGDLKVPVTTDGAKYVIPVDDDIIKLVAGKKFKVKGYEDSIPYMKAEGEGAQLEAAKGLVDKKLMKVVKELDSLYTYCEKSGTATSSYLPKELYDALMAKKV
ncbi:hypothetical protein QFZ77_004412 [Paenibacillus sp. V4I3]|uniref:eCIS core domain-containing protein n=1 Tax=unclassified Paenibacillus TaxID=185978 RepID=UPI00278A5E1E|nr:MULTISPECIES: DUF4157 domain-containing protein [unclassified Paenibacillus]MDQ0875753.1 hypothetical protein [Paenibacillus sp. V4I3]MDQ0888176.1 hypothetical protein [Paenibacillus sp. V4I9]